MGPLVYWVGGRQFACEFVASSDAKPPYAGRHLLSLKCDPDRALLLRDRYDYVQPGYHCNKKYWNTIDYGRARDCEMEAWICHSYLEVVRKFPRREQPFYFDTLRNIYPQYSEAYDR